MSKPQGGGTSVPPSDAPKCDFCSTLYPSWVHPSADFLLPPEQGTGLPAWGSADQAWAACETCHEIIEREDREGLANRSLRMVPGGVPRQARRAMLGQIKKMHAGFWKGRNGKPYRQAPFRVEDGQHK